MKLNQLIKKYVNQREKHERKVGRYYSSELWEILTGKLTPQDFWEEKTYDLLASKNIIEGELREMALKQLLDFSKVPHQYQPKKVLKLKGFEIVAVVDFLFKDKILECKSPSKIDSYRIVSEDFYKKNKK